MLQLVELLESVSYTHLDVYKRQEYEETRIPLCFAREVAECTLLNNTKISNLSSLLQIKYSVNSFYK